MTTQAQIEANRRNAQKSTGPKSKSGKEVVSQNAVKHGLCANKNVIRTESQDEYNEFKENMLADLEPVGAMELMLAERIVSLSWRLKRAEHFQNLVVESLIDINLHDQWCKAENARREAKEGNLELLIGFAINKDFREGQTLDLLLLYERRIESSLYKASAELRKMQKIRKAKENKETGHRIQDTGDNLEEQSQIDFAVTSPGASVLEELGVSHPHPEKDVQDEDVTHVAEYSNSCMHGQDDHAAIVEEYKIRETEKNGIN